MENDHKNKLSKWLEILQQESWQLELIISGFAIFLVGSIYDPLQEWGMELRVAAAGFSNNVIFYLPFTVIMSAWFFLLLNLIFHVILRGLWISTIGLRYVSGDIEWEELQMHDKFKNYLQNKIGSYDDFIEKLEKLCSVVFSFTFMIIFMLISFGLWVLFLVFFVDIVGNDFMDEVLPDWLATPLAIGLTLIFVCSGLLYFIDFLTLGWIKRKKWAAKIYYPFYRLYSYLTLAFLYRPIYYNLIDNKFGRRISKMLVPYLIGVIILGSLHVDFHPFFPLDYDDKNYFSNKYYADKRELNDRIIEHASIPSKFIKNGFLELFLNYEGRRFNRSMEKICPDFEPLHEIGLNSDIVVGFNSGDETIYRENATDTALICLNQLYELKINDSIFQEINYRFYEHPSHGEQGIFTILDVDYLPRGEHLLHINYQASTKDSTYLATLCKIPFWKE